MNLFKMLKISGKVSGENSISGEYFYIGCEGLVFKNVYIPLEAVSIVKLLRIEDESLKPYLITMIIGVFLCISGIVIKFVPLVLACVVIIIIVGILIYRTWKKNQDKVFRILIKLNNGECYTLIYGNFDFTVEIVDKIRTCVMKKSEAPDYFVNQGNIELILDKSVGKICDNIFEGNVGKINTGKNLDINESSDSGLTNEEWNFLKSYLGERKTTFEIGSDYYKCCINMLSYVKKRQAVKMRVFVNSLRDEKKLYPIFVQNVDRDTVEKIREILRKI